MTPKLICVDIDGTLTHGIGGAAVPGAARALAELRKRAPLRLVTNATSRSHAAIAAALAGAGLSDDPRELVTPAITARRVLEARGQASGLLIADPPARSDFGWFQERAGGAAVLLASEAHHLTIAELQPAFRALLDGAAFYTLQRNRYFRQGQELVSDLGPVAAFLGYAAQREAENLGKPSPLLFDALAAEVGAERREIVMLGDDAEFDASGAVSLGLIGLAVRTGKYRPGDEQRVEPPPTALLDSIADLPAWLDGPRLPLDGCQELA